jgi:hypothetical protein
LREFVSFQIFRDDKNDGSKDKLQKYLSDYLSPLTGNGNDTRVTIDDVDWRPRDAVEQLESGSDNLLAGTMLSQDESSQFLRMSRTRLGSEILGDASVLSSNLRAFTERRYDEARTRQLTFLEQWGLNKNIKKTETVLAKIAETFVKRELSPPSQREWINDEQHLNDPSWSQGRNDIRADWLNYDAIQASLAADLPNLRGNTEALSRRFQEALAGRADIVSRTNAFLGDVRSSMSNWDASANSDVRSWSSWLQRRTIATPTLSVGSALLKTQEELQRTQERITRTGRQLNARLKHITDTTSFVRDSEWHLGHGDECPTCETDLTHKQGLLQTLRHVTDVVNSELKTLRLNYQTTTGELKKLEAQLVEAGFDKPPIDAERQAQLVLLLQRFAPTDEDVRESLSRHESATAILKSIDYCLRIPGNISDHTHDDRHTELAKTLNDAFSTSELASEDENAWREVRATLLQQLSTVVDEHLPKTLQALWKEIALNLTPIRVQLPAPFSLDVDARGNQPIATFVIKPESSHARLADYILNSAEVRTLGLSWFFVRYLLRGRFRHSFIVLDDPAQEMDQPTYRELCRFWETLLRMHHRREIPLHLLILLHQDERALDAARATNATIHFLGWNNGKTSLLRRTRMFGTSIVAPTPVPPLSPPL